MPRFLKMKGETPQAAIALQVGIASALVMVSTLQGLLSYLGLTLSLSAACTVACLFSSRVRRRPLLHVTHILPALYVACTLTAATLMTIGDPLQLLGTLVTIVAATLGYFAFRRAPRPGA